MLQIKLMCLSCIFRQEDITLYDCFLFIHTVNESHIVVQALRLNTMSKLTFADCARFDALVKDVFPGTDFKDVDYAELNIALEEVFGEANLEIINVQVNTK